MRVRKERRALALLCGVVALGAASVAQAGSGDLQTPADSMSGLSIGFGLGVSSTTAKVNSVGSLQISSVVKNIQPTGGHTDGLNLSIPDTPVGSGMGYLGTEYEFVVDSDLSGGSLGFVGGLRLTFSMPISQHAILGFEGEALYNSAKVMISSPLENSHSQSFMNGPFGFDTSPDTEIEFKNAIGSVYQYGPDSNTAGTFSNHTRSTEDQPSAEEPAEYTSMGAQSNSDLSLTVKNSWIYLLSGKMSYAMNPKCALGVKVGVALSQCHFNLSVSGSAASSMFFVDSFPNNINGLPGQQVPTPPAVAPVDAIWEVQPTAGGEVFSVGKNFSRVSVGLHVAPILEMKITPNCMLFAEVKGIFFGEGRSFSVDETFDTPNDGAASFTTKLDNVNSASFLLGVSYSFGK